MKDFVILLVSADIVIINKSTCMQNIPPSNFYIDSIHLPRIYEAFILFDKSLFI